MILCIFLDIHLDRSSKLESEDQPHLFFWGRTFGTELIGTNMSVVDSRKIMIYMAYYGLLRFIKIIGYGWK